MAMYDYDLYCEYDYDIIMFFFIIDNIYDIYD